MKPSRLREDEHLALLLMQFMMIRAGLHPAVGQVQHEAGDREVESVFLTHLKMKSKIPMLMELYMEMTEANKKSEFEYKEDKKK